MQCILGASQAWICVRMIENADASARGGHLLLPVGYFAAKSRSSDPQ
ncbi:hypothetical protein HMPREF3036_01467 [Sutterella sp. KLE1602]|nr:hypothetical protein HMPREF3036_01467 [Sutterella sp. KLE1602]